MIPSVILCIPVANSRYYMILVHIAMEQSNESTSSAWKTLQDSPSLSAAASLGGILLAVGGIKRSQGTISKVHAYSPATCSWIQVESGDLPEPRYSCTAVELSANRLEVKMRIIRT